MKIKIKHTVFSKRSEGIRVPWRRHQIETFSALLAIRAGNSPIPGEFPAQRPVTRSFYHVDVSLICARISGWVNNGEAGDFRRHRAHYDVIVMFDNLPGKPSIKVHNRVTWGKTPTLRHEAQISITNGWSSLKLLYDQTFMNFLLCIYFLGKIYDIVEIKQNDYFWPKMGALPHMWAKRPTRGAKRQPMGILPGQDDYNVESSFRINWLQCGLDLYYIIVRLNQLK